jgi:hypothetical protein
MQRKRGPELSRGGFCVVGYGFGARFALRVGVFFVLSMAV